MEKFRSDLKKILPAFLKRSISGYFYGLSGNYPSWNEAQKRSSGYGNQFILNKVEAATSLLKDGKVVYERDSVTFDKIQYSFPLLSGLLWIAALNNGRLNVLDFGGSLGSSYFQNKLFLDSLADVHWCIVEQPNFVKVGSEKFADERLHFYFTIEDCLKSHNIDIVLFSSVLQYLEFPYKLLNEIIGRKFAYIIIDRTPFTQKKDDKITVQKVPPWIYSASYPCWIFNGSKFIDFMTHCYELILEFDSSDKMNPGLRFKGYIFRKR